MKYIFAIAAMTLAGCAKNAEPTHEAKDACPAADYEGLIGAQLAAVTLPSGLNMAVIDHDAEAPTPVDPSRMLVQLDDAGRIVSVTCG